MIKDMELFVELGKIREELEIVAKTYEEFGDIAYDKAVKCCDEENFVAYRVWMELVELCHFCLDETNKEIDEITEKRQGLIGEA